jgi:hypothetical protein
MRYILLLTCLCLFTGCAATPPPQPAQNAPRVYLDRPSAALVFDPPALRGETAYMWPREEREPGAFVSFDGPEVTFYDIHTDDRLEMPGDDGWVYRRAMMDRVGVSFR